MTDEPDREESRAKRPEDAEAFLEARAFGEASSSARWGLEICIGSLPVCVSCRSYSIMARS